MLNQDDPIAVFISCAHNRDTLRHIKVCSDTMSLGTSQSTNYRCTSHAAAWTTPCANGGEKSLCRPQQERREEEQSTDTTIHAFLQELGRTEEQKQSFESTHTKQTRSEGQSQTKRNRRGVERFRCGFLCACLLLFTPAPLARSHWLLIFKRGALALP